MYIFFGNWKLGRWERLTLLGFFALGRVLAKGKCVVCRISSFRLTVSVCSYTKGGTFTTKFDFLSDCVTQARKN